MFASVLLPFAERGAGPLHHWVMLAQMARFSPEEIVFIGDQACFDEATVPFGEWMKVGGLRFRCPTREQFRTFRRITLDDGLAGALAGPGGGHLDVFRRLLLERVPELEDALVRALEPFRSGLEAALTWSNCPSLRGALDRLGGIPLIHNEIGPLRSPLYRETFYFDFKGVNGHTTPVAWEAGEVRAQMHGAQLLPADRVRGLLVADPARVQMASQAAPDGVVGVALQVEDDSNVVAYANGWTSLELLYDVMGRVGPEAMLVRSHPGARFRYAGGLGRPDDSPDSLAFLTRVAEVVSINSSVLVEAAFWGRQFDAKGDNPVRFLARAMEQGGDWEVLAFNTFFLAYLVPSELLFDPEYYRWRLTGPTLAQCHARHLDLLSGRDSPAIAALQAAEGRSTSGLVRLPALWTSTLGLERQVTELSRHADEASAAASRWHEEAERNWEALSWFKQEHARLEAELAECVGLRDTIAGLEAELAACQSLREAVSGLAARLAATPAAGAPDVLRVDTAPAGDIGTDPAAEGPAPAHSHRLELLSAQMSEVLATQVRWMEAQLSGDDLPDVPQDPAEALGWVSARVERLRMHAEEWRARARLVTLARDSLEREARDAARILAALAGPGHDGRDGVAGLARRLQERLEALQAEARDAAGILAPLVGPGQDEQAGTVELARLVHARFEALQSALDALRTGFEALQTDLVTQQAHVARLQQRPPTFLEKLKRIFSRTA